MLQQHAIHSPKHSLLRPWSASLLFEGRYNPLFLVLKATYPTTTFPLLQQSKKLTGDLLSLSPTPYILDWKTGASFFSLLGV